MRSVSTIGILVLLMACSTSANQDKTDQSVTSRKISKKVSNTGNRQVICFVYHRFGDERFPSTNVSINHFESHLTYLKKNDFRVMTFSQALEHIQEGGKYEKIAVITIDDGYDSFYVNGLPLLEKYEFPATLFINTETVGGKDYMDWGQLEDVLGRKVEIGNHTHSHAYFLNLPMQERYVAFREELRTCQKLIEKNLGISPKTVAYPYGELDEEMKDIVRSMGFTGAAAQNSGVVHAGTDLFRCPRFPMSEFYSDPEKFASKANMHPLKLALEQPVSFLLPPDEKTPELTLKFLHADLITDQLQCFIQGSECRKDLSIDADTVTLSLSAISDISQRRRTLYTVTVPDGDGQWHWFSHLWINPEIR